MIRGHRADRSRLRRVLRPRRSAAPDPVLGGRARQRGSAGRVLVPRRHADGADAAIRPRHADGHAVGDRVPLRSTSSRTTACTGRSRCSTSATLEGMTSEGAWKRTACILCECNCGLEVELGGDEAGGTSSSCAATSATRRRGGTRARSRTGSITTSTARDRLTSPLRRRADGTFEAIDWDTAIREVAARLAAVRDTHGGDSDLLLRRRRPGEPPARRVLRRDAARAGLALPLERARAGEDRRVLGRRPHDGQRARAPTSSTATSRCSSARTRGTRTRSRARA